MGKFLITFGLILISGGFIIHLFGDILIWFSNLIGDFSYKGDKCVFTSHLPVC